MNIREISKPITSASLNESLAKKFGQKIKLESFTLAQLADARNRIRTKLSQVETNESFDKVISDENYQKSKLFLDVLNAAIAEREVIEGAKPDFLDMDKDGDKKEPMKKAIKDKKKKIKEGAEDEAELVMAAKDMVDRVTGWMEDTAEMQTESMLELADAIRDEMGSEKSEAFTASVKPALEAMYAAMDSTRQTLTQGVGMLTGEGDAPMMGDMPPVDDEAPMEPTVDADMAAPVDGVDEFGASEPAAGGPDEAGRARRESVQYSKKKLAETSRRLAALLSKKK